MLPLDVMDDRPYASALEQILKVASEDAVRHAVRRRRGSPPSCSFGFLATHCEKTHINVFESGTIQRRRRCIQVFLSCPTSIRICSLPWGVDKIALEKAKEKAARVSCTRRVWRPGYGSRHFVLFECSGGWNLQSAYKSSPSARIGSETVGTGSINSVSRPHRSSCPKRAIIDGDDLGDLIMVPPTACESMMSNMIRGKEISDDRDVKEVGQRALERRLCPHMCRHCHLDPPDMRI